MRSGILVGYFSNISDAKRIVWMLEKHGFFRAALLHRRSHDHLYTMDPFLRFQLIGCILAATAFTVITLLALFFLPDSSAGDLPVSRPIIIAAAVLTGLLAGLLLVRRSRYGVDKSLFPVYAKTLLANETLLLLQAKVTDLHLPLSLILSNAETTPVIFIKHCPYERRAKARPKQYSRDADQPSELHLRRQGAVKPDKKTSVSYDILEKIRKDRKWVQDICADLTAASRVGQGTTDVAEWIIDNEYMIDRCIHDILRNLPRTFFRSLPVIENYPFRGYFPYVYSLARDIVSASDLHLSQDQILAMVEEDQKNRHLSIAELWALPQMLRIVLIEKIKGLAVQAQTDLCESQEASFWANRLIAANRHDVNLLFSVLAELAEAKPQPSLYFGSQLLDPSMMRPRCWFLYNPGLNEPSAIL